MNKWGFFTWPNISWAQLGNKLQEYDISIKNAYGNGDEIEISFSNGKKGHFKYKANSFWIVNDEKNICIQTNDIKQIPVSSADIGIGFVFPTGSLPLVNGEIYSCSPVTTSLYVYETCNIPKGVAVANPDINELILYPFVGKPREESQYLYFKELYICLQRQFMPGTIIKTSNGDSYISAGAWFLFKM